MAISNLYIKIAIQKAGNCLFFSIEIALFFFGSGELNGTICPSNLYIKIALALHEEPMDLVMNKEY